MASSNSSKTLASDVGLWEKVTFNIEKWNKYFWEYSGVT